MRSVLEGGGVMVRQRNMAVASGPSGNVDVSKIPTLRPAVPRPTKLSEPTIVRPVKLATPAQTTQTTQAASPSQRALTDTQVLKIVEKRSAGTNSAGARANGSSNVAVIKPEDTNTRLALRKAVAQNAPVSFAVQLQWSVQPIDIRTLAPHPIFRAYSLYGAQGRRDGRTWFF